MDDRPAQVPPTADTSVPKRSDRLPLTDAKALHLFRGRPGPIPTRRRRYLLLGMLLATGALAAWLLAAR